MTPTERAVAAKISGLVSSPKLKQAPMPTIKKAAAMRRDYKLMADDAGTGTATGKTTTLSTEMTPTERALAAKASGLVSSPKLKQASELAGTVDGISSDGMHSTPPPSSNSKQTLGFGKEQKLAASGYASTRETDSKNIKYVQILQKGVPGTEGILASVNSEGELLIPYSHQRQAVKKAAAVKCDYMLMAHDAGTGKTATFFQLYAAMELLVSGGACCIVTVPPATLPQWEQTAHDWLKLRNKHKTIVVTNKWRQITPEVIAEVRVLILSRQSLANIYKKCWSYEPKYEQNTRGHWVGKWVRDESVPLHPVFAKRWDLMGVDEAHVCRNPTTEWCVSQHQLAAGLLINGKQVGGCRKRIALTATPVFNQPNDMVGLCKCINTAPEYQSKSHWSNDRQGRTINPKTVEEFQRYTDRVKDDILGLPEIHQETHNFCTNLPPEAAIEYNRNIKSAQRLRLRLQDNKITTKELQRLMLLLQRMQQMLVSPRLAEVGAEYFNKNPIELENAAREKTGSLEALHDRLIKLQTDGHKRIIVAANHVTLMQIARKYLERQNEEMPEKSVGKILIYDGTLSLTQRAAQRTRFFSEERCVLFLSILAGGTGLHLVPIGQDIAESGFCRSVVFWGSRPFSPQQVWQTLKRIHRIGQQYKVFVHHLIADGSVDYAINCIHQDKAGLANAIVDNDWTDCDQVGGEWRKTGRIVDMCTTMQADGNFPEYLDGEWKMTQPIAGEPISPSLPPQLVPVIHGQSLFSQFFRQPLYQAAAAAAAAAPIGQTSVKRERDTGFYFEAAKRPHVCAFSSTRPAPRAVPLPDLATSLPFGPAFMCTKHPPPTDAPTLVQEAKQAGPGSVKLEL